MTNEEREEFRQDMLADAYEERANQKHEFMIRTDYDTFLSEHEDLYTDFRDAVEAIKQAHLMYDIQFDYKELEDVLWVIYT